MKEEVMENRLLNANDIGVRLEIIGGMHIWEAQPLYKHQKAVDRIRSGIQKKENSTCACIHAADVYVHFPDGSLKRPDISIFCREPDEEDSAITLIPEAVIEIVSKGYEYKDLEIAPNFYLAHGVKDVVVYNPYTLGVLHVRKDRVIHHISPVKIEFECGCNVLV
jgi:hypothetical protein